MYTESRNQLWNTINLAQKVQEMNGHQTNPITKPPDTRCNTIMEAESGNQNFISSAIVTDQIRPASFAGVF